jgi:hypothetical protein
VQDILFNDGIFIKLVFFYSFEEDYFIFQADKYRFKKSYSYLLPKSYDDQELFDISFLHSILPDNRRPICIDAQCIRSASFWSCGIHTIERSIENAYIHMIDNAKYFIYIEVFLYFLI